MKNQKTGKWIVGLGLSLLVAGTVQASVVYQDTFSTDGTLAGRAVETGTGTWIGHSNLQTTSGVALPAATNPGKNALLAFTPETGKIYTLSADVNAVSGSWLAFGFVSDTNSAMVGNEFFFDYVDSEAPWMYVVPAGNIQTFAGPGTGGISGFPGVGAAGTMEIRLDTTGSNWEATYFFNGAVLRTKIFSGSLNITHVGFGGMPVSIQEVDNFTLEAVVGVPPPAGVIYQDTFGTDGSLAGRMVETGGGTWIGHSALQTTNGVALPAATYPGKNALLAFAPATGMVYTLSVDVDAISGSWAAIGFVSDTASTIVGNEFFYDYVDTEAPWMNVSPGGTVQTFSGPKSEGIEIGTGGDTGTVKIELDTSGSDWEATYYFNEALLRTHTFSGSLNITHVGFGGLPLSIQEIDNFSLEFISTVSSYEQWAGGWGVDIGAETNDFDSDGLNNLYEYGLDGDPTNGLDRGTSPTYGVVQDGGASMFGYVHPQLSDPNNGLAYSLALNTDLVAGAWETNTGYIVTGTNITGNALDFVTNVTDTVDDKKFIRLIIEAL